MLVLLDHRHGTVAERKRTGWYCCLCVVSAGLPLYSMPMTYVLEDPSATSIPMMYAMGMPMIYHTRVIMDVWHVVWGTRMVPHGTYQGTKGRCRNMLGDEGNA